ncbi:MAG: ISL3 family transposase [Anaerolineales bacterium]|nr:ISL3 family transposase [Anaerolineales bacterium]
MHLAVRRFFCHHEPCSRRTFAESFPELVCFKKRRTNRLSQQQLAVAFAISGEAGRRLLTLLAMPLSGDTLIRDIRCQPEVEAQTPRVLGIDDWAKKRGHTYGTILVDLESRQPIDLLDSREVADVTVWLQQHTGIEIISRDRGQDYAKATSLGAPEAQQVADRWHLLKNLREVVETVLSQKPDVLAAAGKVEETDVSQQPTQTSPVKEETPTTTVTASAAPEAVSQTPVNKTPTKADQRQAARQARKQARFELVKQLHREGHSKREIQRHLKISWRTVDKYLAADTCPIYTCGRKRPSMLTPWLPHLEERWQAGYTNATQLWREMEAQGFRGSRGLVARWAARERKLLPPTTQYSRQQPREVRPKLTRQTRPVPWSAPRASWIVVKERALRDDQEKAALERMIAADAQVKLVAQLAERFVTMVKQREAEKLEQWLQDAAASGVRSFISFASGLRQDITAVYNALSMSWSNGQTEGQVNRLKFIKRMMYGRANFDLLRKRFLYRPMTA